MKFRVPAPFQSFLVRTLLALMVLSGSAVRAQSPAFEETVILRGVRVIDGSGTAPQEHRDIVIKGQLITGIVPTSDQPAPEGARVIDGSGKTVIPGLISAHSHIGFTNQTSRGPENFTRENVLRQLKQYEAYGVTTVVSLGTNQPLIYEIRKEAHAGSIPGADLFSADRGIGVIGGAPGNVNLNGLDQIDRPTTADEARKAVRTAHANGADLIKTWVDSRNGMPAVSKEVYTAVIDEAHKLGLKVAAHIFTLADARGLVAAGVDIIAHGIRDQPVDPQLVEAMKSRGTWYIPTLALDDAFYIYADQPAWMKQPFFLNSVQSGLLNEISDPAWQQKTLAAPSTAAAREAVKMNQRNLLILHDAGVRIGLGTDSGAFPLRIPGFAEHRELQLMAEAGLPNSSILSIATGQSAELLGLEDRGQIAAGKLADLIVLDANPLEDISATQRIHSVWHRGQQVSGPIENFRPDGQ